MQFLGKKSKHLKLTHYVALCVLYSSHIMMTTLADSTNQSQKVKLDEIRTKLSNSDVVRNCEPCGGFNSPNNGGSFKRSSGGNKETRSASPKPKFRIVGGTKSVKARPWMAFLQIMEDSRCGGSVINKLFILTAAHCMCTYFECKTNAAGDRISDYDPKKDVKIFLGFKDLNQIFELPRLKNVSENEYSAAKVIVHPKYNDALYDLALVRSSKEFSFGPNVQPICLPFGDAFPDIRSDATVAGWGTLKNSECFTDDHGPNPNSQCAFPFVFDGVVHQNCHFGENPSANDQLCKQFRQTNPDALTAPQDEILLFDDRNSTKSIRSCYFPSAGTKGWCATCKLIASNLSDPHLCVSERWEPATVSADEHWGWCNKLCDDGQDLLPLHLKEVTLVVFPPEKCRRMLNATGAPYGDDIELCAGFVSQRRRKSFLVDESQGVRRITFQGMPEKKSDFDLIGGKDACTGDSGGPLWVEMGKSSKRAFLVGVVSRGFNCASHNMPGIYVRVKKFLTWIMETSKEGQC